MGEQISSNFIIHSEVSGSNGADVTDIIQILHSSYKEAHRLLYKEILEDLSPKELGFQESDDIFSIASKDQAMLNTKGYGLPTGAFRHLHDGLTLALLKSEKSQQFASIVDGKLQFNTAFLSKKLVAIERFLEHLFPVIHLLGLPKRGTELESCQVLNSEQRPRNVKAYFNQILIGGGYNKTSGITGKDTHTLHMFPKSVEELLLTYLAWVHPFQTRVVPMVVKKVDPDFSEYLWASKGRKWNATKFSHILREKTRAITSNGVGFGLHDMRHISAGINDHYDLKRPEVVDHVADLSSGHKTATAESRYAITPQQDQRYSQAYVYTCQDFFKKLHYLFGFDGNSLQLRSEQDLWTISRGKEEESQSLLMLQNMHDQLEKLRTQQELLSEHLDQIILGQMKALQGQFSSQEKQQVHNMPILLNEQQRRQNESPNLTPTKLYGGAQGQAVPLHMSPVPTMATPTKQFGADQRLESISTATPSPRALALGKKKAFELGIADSRAEGPIQSLSSIVRVQTKQSHPGSRLFNSEIEVIQSVLQNRSQAVQGKTVMQRLQYALKTVPRTTGNSLVCCECGTQFSGVDSLELLYRHFLTKNTDGAHKESHKLCVTIRLPLEGKAKSAIYYRMDKHGNFGFICEAPGCARHFANTAALKEHIQALTKKEASQHGYYTYLTYSKKMAPHHHLGTKRVDFEAQDIEAM